METHTDGDPMEPLSPDDTCRGLLGENQRLLAELDALEQQVDAYEDRILRHTAQRRQCEDKIRMLRADLNMVLLQSDRNRADADAKQLEVDRRELEIKKLNRECAKDVKYIAVLERANENDMERCRLCFDEASARHRLLVQQCIGWNELGMHFAKPSKRRRTEAKWIYAIPVELVPFHPS